MDNWIAVLTLVHVVVSIIAIGAGFIVVGGFYTNRLLTSSNTIFLVMTVLTCATGFMFPITGFTPAIGVGVVTSLILIPTCYAVFIGKLAGRWRLIYLIGAVAVLYFNVFVLFAQLFLRLPPLRELAPTQREAPFMIVQLGVLLTFIAIGIVANARFKPSAKVTVN